MIKIDQLSEKLHKENEGVPNLWNVVCIVQLLIRTCVKDTTEVAALQLTALRGMAMSCAHVKRDIREMVTPAMVSQQNIF